MKTIFLDRDGVINRNPPGWGYVQMWEEFYFIPNALNAIRDLTESGYRIIVVTNQAGIGKGLFSEDNLKDIHSRMVAEITEAGGRIDAVYYCPHHPEAGWECRKPKPGMLRCAAHEYNIELRNAYLVGDSTTEIEAGQRAGTTTFLVLTGHGTKSYQHYIKATSSQRSDTDDIRNRNRRTADEGLARAAKYCPEKIFTNLYTWSRWLLKNDT